MPAVDHQSRGPSDAPGCCLSSKRRGLGDHVTKLSSRANRKVTGGVTPYVILELVMLYYVENTTPLHEQIRSRPSKKVITFMQELRPNYSNCRIPRDTYDLC